MQNNLNFFLIHIYQNKRDALGVSSFWWREMDSNHRSKMQQIYSLPPLATREPLHIQLKKWSW